MASKAKESSSNHWVAELFKPNFTTKELLSPENSSLKASNIQLANDFYSKIYSKVILEEERQLKQKHAQQAERIVASIILEDDDDDITNETKFINKEDLEFLKKNGNTGALKIAYQELRERAVWLLCVLESRNSKISDLENKLQQLEKDGSKEKESSSQLLKENFKLKSLTTTYTNIIGDLEKKLEFYEDCNNRLKEVVQNLSKEVLHYKKSFETKCKILSKFKEDSNKELERFIKESNSKWIEKSSAYEKDIVRLNKVISDLESNLKQKERICSDFKISLNKLEKHVTELKTQQGMNVQNMFFCPTQTKEEYLNVTDI